MSDDRTEDVLRRALSVEAQQVRPDGDGLSRIQQRVDARHARLRWMRPALAGAAAIVIAGGTVGGYAIATHGDGNSVVKVEPAQSASPTAVPVDSEGYPADAIFPYTTAAQEHSWEQEYAGGHSPWVADPTAVTESWLRYYLKQGGAFAYRAETAGGSSDVTVSRSVGGSDHAVTVVHLVKYGNAWLVTGASDPAGYLTFSSPAAGSAVASPLTVTGPGYGVDEVASIALRDAPGLQLLGSANTSFGNGTAQWSATIPFTTTTDAGAVVASVFSAADGGLSTLAAEKVTFSGPGNQGTAPVAYGVEAGRLVQLDPATGAVVGPVDAANAFGPIVEVRRIGESLYFTPRVADCLSTLYSMPVAGGTPTTVATADPGYGIVGFDLSPDGTRLVYFESGCGDNAGKGNLVFTQLTGVGSSGQVPFPSEPPALIGDPVWEADGVHVDAFIRTGMGGYLARYDTESERTATPNANSCSGFDVNSGMPDALAVGPDGVLWFAVETGSSMQVISCASGNPTVEFTVDGNGTPVSLSINEAGQALLTDDQGSVYSWAPGDAAQQLDKASGVTSATW